MVINSLLMRLTEEEALVVEAFTDDTFAVAKKPGRFTIRSILAPVLLEIRHWASKSNL